MDGDVQLPQVSLMRWRLILMESDNELLYSPGRVHQVPDALSRLEFPEEAETHAEVDEEILCYVEVAKKFIPRSFLGREEVITRDITSREGLRSLMLRQRYLVAQKVRRKEDKRANGNIPSTFHSKQRRISWMMIPRM